MRILIAGGGTGGHVYPGIAIAKELKSADQNVEVLFVGTAQGLENKIVPKEGFKLKTIRSKGINRNSVIDNIKTLNINIAGLKDAKAIVKDFKPDIAIGTGGYVTGPVILVCALSKVRTIIHESNVIPGVANKILSRFVDYIAISYKDTKKYFKVADSKIKVTGNPVRKDLFLYKKFQSKYALGFDTQKPLIVSVGGSRGAQNINAAILNYINEFLPSSIQFLFITGENQYDKIMGKLDMTKHKNLKVVPFSYKMPQVYAASDLIICRAGAMTISEVSASGVPSILIPSPYVAENHQEYNARALKRAGSAKIILEKNLNEDVLKTNINELIYDKNKLNDMSEKAKMMSKPDAVDEIVRLINKLVEC
jgi:UDP-N-acetylglucosamine--N-acetylmuramyl-(pentapeptide) pyrophosphoryl-undecaprenol N-acetylglucosamine transferase